VPLPRASTAPTGWWLHQGQIEEAGHPDEVLGNPKSERLQQFLSGNLK
jgi:histidine transport system ATP-binding protein